MIVGVGIDSLRIARMEQAMKRERFLEKVFTVKENRYLKDKVRAEQSAAGMFCVKEAVMKALGLGITEVRLHDIEVLHKENGAPYVVLHGNLKLKADTLHASITHTEDTANAVVILEKED